MLLQTGPIRLALVDSGGTKLKTLYLPPPDKDGLDLEFIEKSSSAELIDGSERTRLLGFLPTLNVRWKYYNEQTGFGYAIGTNDGQRPSLEALLKILSGPTNTLRVAPGPAVDGGFTVDRVQVKGIGKVGNTYTGLQVTFRARNVRSDRSLEAF